MLDWGNRPVRGPVRIRTIAAGEEFPNPGQSVTSCRNSISWSSATRFPVLLEQAQDVRLRALSEGCWDEAD